MTETMVVEVENLQKFVTQMFGEHSGSNMGTTDAAVEQMTQWLKQFSNVEGCVECIAREDLEQVVATLSFDQSELWQAIFPLPEQWSQHFATPIEQVHTLIDPYLQEVYQAAFDQYIQLFGATSLTKFMTVQTMALMAYVAASYFANQRAFYEPIVQLYEAGHMIIGIKGNTLYVS